MNFILRQKKQLNLGILAGLLVLWTGCTTSKIILHPITGKDFCAKGDSTCTVDGMDFGMSEYFLNEVLRVKIDKN